MPLLCYNLTASPVTLAVVGKVIPASASAPSRGPAVDVTSEMKPNLTVDPAKGKTGGLTGANFVSIQAQVTAASLTFQWTSSPEYLTTGLTVSGPTPAAHTHTNANTTATNNDATATNQNTAGPSLINISAPAAESATGVHAAFAGNDASNDFPGPFTSPDVPRNLTVTFAAAWDGGNVVVTGTDQFDVVTTETFTANPGNTVIGTKIFKTVTAATKGAVGAAADAASIGTGKKLGLPVILQAYGILAVDGVPEAATFDATYYGVTPTTAPNGVKNFLALVEVNHAHTQNAHTHTQSAHTHTMS